MFDVPDEGVQSIGETVMAEFPCLLVVEMFDRPQGNGEPQEAYCTAGENRPETHGLVPLLEV